MSVIYNWCGCSACNGRSCDQLASLSQARAYKLFTNHQAKGKTLTPLIPSGKFIDSLYLIVRDVSRHHNFLISI